MTNAAGEAVLARAIDLAGTAFGDRLVAAYALGSLAHGGFSALVSDVDLGLIVAGPLREDDADRIRRLTAAVAAGGQPLADRLSVFWGTPATLRGEEPGGRFPPLDRLDLIEHGRLLAGREARAGLPRPDRRDLTVAGAAFAIGSLGTPEVIAEIADPEGLIAAGPRRLTKRILFPVRFLYTARTGEIGRNDAAVADLIARDSGPVADLAAAALRWRAAGPDPGDPAATDLVRRVLIPLYQTFLDDHIPRLREYGEPDLARRLSEWRDALARAQAQPPV